MAQSVSGVRRALRASASLLVAGLAWSAAGAASAEAPLVTSEKPVAGRYIVVFEQGSDVPAMMQKMAEWSGGTAVMQYDVVLPGGAFDMSASQARMATRMPGVAWVEEASVVELAVAQNFQTRDYALDLISDGAGFSSQFDGSGVTIYVADTGANQHQLYGNRVSVLRDLITPGGQAPDENGHGSRVTGNALGQSTGAASGARGSEIRIFNATGQTSNDIVIGSFDAAARDAQSRPGTEVYNGSFSGPASPASDRAATALVQAGVVVVIAAGNDGRDACQNSPARADQIITVGAVDRDARVANFSNFGSCVEIFAPGVQVVSTSSAGPTLLATQSGTSFASPLTAGAAALVIEEFRTRGVAEPTPAQVGQRLFELAQRGRVSGAQGAQGNGLLLQVP